MRKGGAAKKFSLRIGGFSDVQYLVMGGFSRRLKCSVVTRIPPREKAHGIKSSHRNWLSGSGSATALYGGGGNLDASELIRRRYSRSKAQYLIEAAQAVARGSIDVETLTAGSAVAAEKTLLAQRGIGIWTARYVLIRSGFADPAPIGDSGLASALKWLCQLPAKPNADQASAIMNRFAPHRSLASGHLWASLKDIDSVPSPISHD